MPRYEETEVTAVQLAVILSRGAFESGFMGSEGVASLVDRVMSADPRISDSLKFRTEMLAFCYLPLDIVLVGHHPADAVRVRGAALVFMAGALKAGVDSPQQFDWDEVPEFIANRLKSYAEILDQPSLGPGPPPVVREAYRNISGGERHPTGEAYLAVELAMQLKHMPEALQSYRIIPDD